MAEPSLFAAPQAAAHGGAAGGALAITVALLVVLGFIAALAWFARRARGGFTRKGGARIQVLASQPLGVKESAVLVRVGETDILVGVAPGSVRPIHVFPAGAVTEPPVTAEEPKPATPGFKELLLRSLGR